MASLQEVIDQLKDNNKAQEDTSKAVASLSDSITKWIKKQDSLLKRGPAEEAAREAAKKKAPLSAFQQGRESAQGIMPSSLFDVTGMLRPLLAGVAAFGAGMAGMRGWEIPAINAISTSVTDFVGKWSSGLDDLAKQSLSRIFGIDPLTGIVDEKGVRRGPSGRFFAGEAKTLSQIITEGFGNMRANVLARFGLAADGSILRAAGAAEDAADTVPLATRVGNAIIRMTSPLTSLVSGVTSWTAGAGAKTLGFLDEIFGISKATGAVSGGLGKMFGAFGKILAPLGFLISVYDGVKAFMESDEQGFIARLGEGVGGFLGSFIGAPFDLIKSAILWIMKKIFPGLTNEDGTYDQSTIAGRVASAVAEFSIAEFISSLVSAPFKWIQSAIDWIVGVFADPKQGLIDAWNGILSILPGSPAELMDIFWFPVNAAVNFVRDMFGWSEEGAPKFSIGTFVFEKIDMINEIIGNALDDLVLWFRHLPARVSLTLEEKWTELSFKLQEGWITFATWAAGLPDKILGAAASSIQASFPRLSSWFGIDDVMSGVEGRAAGRAAAGEAALGALNATRASSLADIERRRQELEQAISSQQSRGAVVYVDASSNPVTSVSGGSGPKATAPTSYDIGAVRRGGFIQ